MSETAEIPECLSIMICDDIYRDERTKKAVLIGVFNEIRAVSFPHAHQRMFVFFTLTSGRGEYELSLKVEHAATGVKVLEMKGPLKMPGPLATMDFHVELLGLRFPEPGKYWIALTINGEPIKSRPLEVRKLEVQP